MPTKTTISLDAIASAGRITLASLLLPSAGLFAQPTIDWPVDATLNEDVVLMMHVDNDRNTGSMTDYRCGDQYVYDGHRGTDITALNFRQMDEGIPVVAAAPGIVSWTRDGEFDRNYWPPYIGDPNGIIIQHAGGWNTQYWHLRKNSVSVEVGETVAAGQTIAHIGSSGQTPIPHLHFEVQTLRGGTLTYHDPFPGTCNDREGLWRTDYPYPGDIDIRILDMDVMIDRPLLGNEQNNYFGSTILKDRPTRPHTIANTEARIGIWVELQASPGASYTIQLIRPDGTEFRSEQKEVTTKKGIQWHVFSWWWGEVLVEDADRGRWTLNLTSDGTVLRKSHFDVGAATLLPVRFEPIAGRSIRLDGEEKTDRLQTTGGTGQVHFQLVDAPDFVLLDGDAVTIPAGARIASRQTMFGVAAVDESGRTDTMRYHLVDPLSPVAVAAERSELLPSQSGLPHVVVTPNPFQGSVEMTLTSNRELRVQVAIFDVLGRQVRTPHTALVGPGRRQIHLSTVDLPPGVYFVRISSFGSPYVTKTVVKTG